MDKKLARQFVMKVSPLERSKNLADRKEARKAERKLKTILKGIPEPRLRA